MPRLDWSAPGPVAQRFMVSRGPVDAIMGPVGSGKSTTMLRKSVDIGFEQAPSPVRRVRMADGRELPARMIKWCCVHVTYRQLWRGIIPTWKSMWPESTLKSFQGGVGQPARHQIKFDCGDGTALLYEIEFAAIQDLDIEMFMRGYEVTGFLIEEADLHSARVLGEGRKRAGRFPSMADGGPSWFGVQLCLNAPEEDSYINDQFRDNLPDGWGFFVQPPAMIETSRNVWVENPKAENLQNLPPGYYRQMIANADRNSIMRMVGNRSAPNPTGRPVFEENWNRDFHVAAAALLPVPGVRLCLGADAGRNPAVMIFQELKDGQVLFLDEIVATNLAARAFGKVVNQVLGEPKYAEFSKPDLLTGEILIEAWNDPSTYHNETSDETWAEIMRDETGIDWRPAPGGNDLTLRFDIVDNLLIETIGQGRPKLLVSPTCKVFIKGMDGAYNLQRFKVANQERYADKPRKNTGYDHIQDGAANGLLGKLGVVAALQRRDAGEGRERQAKAVSDLEPDGDYGIGGRRGMTKRRWRLRQREQQFAD